MPKPNRGASLKWRDERNEWEIIWFERGKRRRRSTGTADRQDADRALADHLYAQQAKALQTAGPRYPNQITVTEALTLYVSEHGPQAKDAARIGYAVKALLTFWGTLGVDAVKGETCRDFYRRRRAELAAKFPARAAASRPSPVDKAGPAAFDGTIRKELSTLGAAMTHCAKEGHLLNPPEVWLPPKRPSKEEWLTRQQAAALIRAARKDPRSRRSLPLFILTGLYMGQRKEAILGLQWLPNFDGGWVDLDRAVIHWRAEDEVESNKKRPKAPIPKRLLRFLRYAKRRSVQFVFERTEDGPNGTMIRTRLGDIRHPFATAAVNAGLGTWEAKAQEKGKPRHTVRIPHAEVTPHVLRHTCITWLLQRAVPIRQVAGFVGATEEMIERVYGHHHPDHMQAARKALD